MSCTVSLLGFVSASDAVAENVTVAPGSAGESSVNTEKLGRLFTLNGEVVVPVPCLETELQRGLTATESHTHAYQSFSSKNGATSVVVVAARACVPLVTDPETAHCVPPGSHTGAPPAVAVGASPVLQMSK